VTPQDAAFAIAIVLMLVALLAPVIGPQVGHAWAAWRDERAMRSQLRRLDHEPDAISFDEAPPEVQDAIRRSLVAMGVVAQERAPAGGDSLPPGRQSLNMPGRPFSLSPWSPPVPEHARNAPWSMVHRFAPGAQRQTDPRGMCHGEEPPLSFICMGCELEQPPLTSDRSCAYCGLVLKVRGPRVFWWREAVEVGEWRP